jgi:hypothetical protein
VQQHAVRRHAAARARHLCAGRPALQGASKAEIANYWDDKSSFGIAQATCTKSKLTRDGSFFSITYKCADIRGDGEIAGGATVVTIAKTTSFTRSGEAYRC